MKFLVLSIILLSINAKVASQNVVLKGTLESYPLKTLSLAKVADIVTNKRTVLAKDNVEGEQRFFLSFEIDQPCLAYLSNFPVFISPGDTVDLFLRGSGARKTDSISASGRLGAQYEFFYQQKGQRPKLSYYRRSEYGKDFLGYKSNIMESWRKDSSFVEDYMKNNEVTAAFVDFCRQELKYRYQGVLMSVNRYAGRKPKLKDIPVGYFDFISIGDFKDDKNLNHVGYAAAAAAYNYYLTDLATRDSLRRTSGKYFWALYENAKEDFSGETLEFLTYRIMRGYRHYHHDGIDSLMKRIYTEAVANFKNPSVVKNIRKAYDEYDMENKPFPEAVLADALVSIDGQTTTFGEVLNSHRGKVIYIDFWASWCKPCIAEMPSSHQLAGKLKDAEISFLYLSQDQVRTSWEQAQSHLKGSKNSFLLKDKASKIVDYLSVFSIPRYIIIDKKGNLVNRQAPRPSDAKILTALENYLDQ